MKLNHGLLWVVLVSTLLAGCASAPLDYPRDPSVALEDTADTSLADKAANWLDGNTESNGFYPLLEGFDAFGARLALMRRAEVSIDAQYFLMKPDNAGFVFAAKLLEAAERGVRVRLLLDDVFTTVDDAALAFLDDHPNIEVRIFNPVARQGIYAFNYLGNFTLANRRMHNKSFIADNQVAIVGGRNIAVEYFQLETTGEFIDFDIFTAGPIVREISTEFDNYWNHGLAVPMEALYGENDSGKLAEKAGNLQRQMDLAGDSIYADAINTPLMTQIYANSLDPYIGAASLFVDDPQKLLEEVSVTRQITANGFREALAAADEEIIIFTPYFIPGERGMAFIEKLREKDLRIVLLTNSLATNNHTSVHSAYSSYRKRLLQAGVELWEARPDAAKITTEAGETELEQLTLHSKGALIDGRRVFVGSLNLDPRSIDINTELGLLIDSPELGQRLTESALERVQRIGYRLELDEDNRISWHATIDGREVVETSDPQTSVWRRMSAWFLKIAPEKQL